MSCLRPPAVLLRTDERKLLMPIDVVIEAAIRFSRRKMSSTRLYTLLVLSAFFLAGCSKEENFDYDLDGVTVNGIIWAKSNLDVPGTFSSSPETPGMFYQWNRRTAWPDSGDIPDWDYSDEPGDGWARANNPCPRGWRVPLYAEMLSLGNLSKVSYQWDNIRKGGLFTDKTTGASVFLPASGLRQVSVSNVGSLGFYWSGSAMDEGNGYFMSITDEKVFPNYFGGRSYGFSIRCVADR